MHEAEELALRRERDEARRECRRLRAELDLERQRRAWEPGAEDRAEPLASAALRLARLAALDLEAGECLARLGDLLFEARQIGRT